jgi:hypothetical protein
MKEYDDVIDPTTALTGAAPHTPPRQEQATDPSRPATTTFQEDLTTSGQRTINLIWENTQGRIALYVIVGTMVIDGLCVVVSVILGKDLTAAQALALGFVNSLSTGVVSFYFSRTNHTQIGGIGNKPNEDYKGR